LIIELLMKNRQGFQREIICAGMGRGLSWRHTTVTFNVSKAAREAGARPASTEKIMTKWELATISRLGSDP
jgi:hypothetical protein